MTGEEDRAFWTWAAVETLRHTGIRIEELTELSHHSLIQYSLPDSGEVIPLLQIVPSKTDAERLLVISPELTDVLAAIITRVRCSDGAVGCVTSYDSHERVWNPPMPLLFQRRIGVEHRAIPADTLRGWIGRALNGTNVTDAAGKPLRFTPHDFRRMFITDAVMHGMPPHIAQLVAGHRDINTTMGYKAVYPEEVINGHRAFIARRRELRPSAEYRVPTERGMGRVPRPLRTTQGRPRHLRPLIRHCVHPRARLPALPAAAARPCPAPSADRGSRQSDRPSRRSPTGGLAR